MGHRLVSCRLNCDGIENEPRKGILPRGLYLEKTSDFNAPECFIVGINPGRSAFHEQEYYKKNGSSYEVVKSFFEESSSRVKYFESLRKFAKQIGLGDAILWTNLCKCENKKAVKSPPLQTFRVCVKNFLREELALFPDCPIIGVGNQPFGALCYMLPDRFIIGVPHPKGPFSKFPRLFDESGRLKPEYEKAIKMTKDKHGNANSVKLSPS